MVTPVCADAAAQDETPLAVPAHLPPLTQLALKLCDVFELRGSSFRVKCTVCGLRITASTHKLIYGHYLRQPRNDIKWCVDLSILARDHPGFHADVVQKQEKLDNKRRCVLATLPLRLLRCRVG